MSLESLEKVAEQLGKTVLGLTSEVAAMQRAQQVQQAAPEPLRHRVTAYAQSLPFENINRLPFFFAAGWGWPRSLVELPPDAKPETSTHDVTDSGLAEMRQWDGMKLTIVKVEPIDPEAAKRAEEDRRLRAAMELAESLGMKLVSKDEQAAKTQPQQPRK
jgi:hypothetical protein